MFMKYIFLIAILIKSSLGLAALVSSIPSTYNEIGIPNSHLVTNNIIRGMAPRNHQDLEDLVELNVQKYLLFKIDTNGEIAKEITALIELGISPKNILHLPFPWKDITDFKPVCEMTIEALNMLSLAERNNHKLFLHCTVGEDRTGYIAGLFKLYNNANNESIDEIFASELCDKGFEAGNPKKIFHVAQKVRDNLTPAFLGMSELIIANRGKKLTKNLCKKLVIPKVDFKKYSCKQSKLI